MPPIFILFCCLNDIGYFCSICFGDPPFLLCLIRNSVAFLLNQCWYCLKMDCGTSCYRLGCWSWNGLSTDHVVKIIWMEGQQMCVPQWWTCIHERQKQGLSSVPGCHDLIIHKQILCLSFPSSTVNANSDRNCVGYHFKVNLNLLPTAIMLHFL